MQQKRKVLLSLALMLKSTKMATLVSSRVSARNRLVTGEVDVMIVTHIDAATNQTIGSNATLIPFIEKDRV